MGWQGVMQQDSVVALRQHRNFRSDLYCAAWCGVKLYLLTHELCNSKAPSKSSPDVEIFLPRLENSWEVGVFIGPKISTAIGANRYSLPMLLLL